jgi:2-C-methyl-D-erythritol 4-phosphate cytidylyltransferase
MGRFAVILPAAGQSSRFGNRREKKIYAELDGRAVWLRATEPFLNRPDVGQMILAIAPEDRDLFERRFRPSVAFLDIRVIEGGAERHDTVAKALALLDASCDHVAIHDAARPCLAAELVDAVFAAAISHGAALPGLPVTDTVKRVNADGFSLETPPRAGLYTVQTPQAFRRDLLERAHARRGELGAAITDDAQLVEALGHPCKVVEGSRYNLKITVPEDLALASAYLALLPRAKPRRSEHPFADEAAIWGEPPLS